MGQHVSLNFWVKALKWFTLGIKLVNVYKVCKEVCSIILLYCLKEKGLINMSVVIYIFYCTLSSFPVLNGHSNCLKTKSLFYLYINERAHFLPTNLISIVFLKLNLILLLYLSISTVEHIYFEQTKKVLKYLCFSFF